MLMVFKHLAENPLQLYLSTMVTTGLIVWVVCVILWCIWLNAQTDRAGIWCEDYHTGQLHCITRYQDLPTLHTPKHRKTKYCTILSKNCLYTNISSKHRKIQKCYIMLNVQQKKRQHLKSYTVLTLNINCIVYQQKFKTTTIICISL